MNHIFFCLDKNYIKFVSLIIKSFIKYHDLKLYQINLIVYNIQEHKILEDIIENISKDINYTIKDFIPSSMLIDLLSKFHKIHPKDKFGIFSNIANWSRFYISNLYPEIDTGLYLDLDILFNKNIDSLFNIELNNKLIGVIQNNSKIFKILNSNSKLQISIKNSKDLKPFNKEIKSIQKNLDTVNLVFKDIIMKQTYNCGVILFNFKLWKSNNITETIINFLNHQVSNKRLICKGGTQPIMNLIVNDYEILDNKYNIIYDDKDKKNIFKKASIIHFKGINSYDKMNDLL